MKEKKSKEVAKLEDVSEVIVRDPLTGKEKTLVIDRRGTTEEKLIWDLANPDLSRDRKDYAVSMYLYERGKESASFITDIMRYKGQHTKETRVFKSQMRFDFEMLVDMFASHLEDQARRTAEILSFNLDGVRAGYEEWLKLPDNKGTSATYLDFVASQGYPMDEQRYMRCAVISQAIFDLEFAQDLRKRREKITAAREAEKGKGIYLSGAGVPFLHDDPQLDEALTRDRELTAEAKEDHD